MAYSGFRRPRGFLGGWPQSPRSTLKDPLCQTHTFCQANRPRLQPETAPAHPSRLTQARRAGPRVGEQLKSVPRTPARPIAVVVPEFSTPRAEKTIDSRRFPTAGGSPRRTPGDMRSLRLKICDVPRPPAFCCLFSQPTVGRQTGSLAHPSASPLHAPAPLTKPDLPQLPAGRYDAWLAGRWPGSGQAEEVGATWDASW